MVDFFQGFSLSEAEKSECFNELFKQVLAPSDRQPSRYLVSKEESDYLSVSKSVFDVSLNITAINHRYKEDLIYSIVFDKVSFFGSGYCTINGKLLLDLLTNTLVDVNAFANGGFYEKCNLKDVNTSMDRYVSHNINKNTQDSLNPRNTHILPFGRRSFNFAHWHLNTLSSIYLAMHHVPEAIIVLPKLNNWQKESLISLGLYNEDKITEISVLDSCIVPNAMFFNTSFVWQRIPAVKPMISMFKDADFARNPPEGIFNKWPTLPSRIYLSRKTDPNHKLVNEQLVEKELASRGFIILEPQTISYHELAYLLAHVDILAGQTGSALIRAGMCKPGAILIQLAYEGITDYIFHKTAVFAGCSKSYVYLEPEQSIIIGPDAVKANHFHRISGWSVNIDNFKAFMQSIF